MRGWIRARARLSLREVSGYLDKKKRAREGAFGVIFLLKLWALEIKTLIVGTGSSFPILRASFVCVCVLCGLSFFLMFEYLTRTINAV